jgi:purine-binding chemotaxis protein CheW
VTVPISEIKPPPEFGGALDTRFLQGLAAVGEQLLILIDIERLMTSREMSIIDEAAEPQ